MAITFIGHKLHYTVDNESDIQSTWDAGCTVYVTNSNKDYMMLSGGSYVSMTLPTAYVNGTLYSNVFSYFASGIVSSGSITFYLTDNGLSSGNAVFKNNVFTQSINLITNSTSNQYQYGGFTVGASNKSITISVSQIGLSLGILNFTSAANGITVYLQISGN